MKNRASKIVYIIALLTLTAFTLTILLSACGHKGVDTDEQFPSVTDGEIIDSQSPEEESSPYYVRVTEGDAEYIYFGSVCDKVASSLLTEKLESKLASGTAEFDERGYIICEGGLYAPVTAVDREETVILSDGFAMEGGRRYFVEVLPIKWRVLEESNGVAVLFADRVIGKSVFNEASSFDSVTGYIKGTDIAANDYEASHIRKYLNGDFMQTLFTAEERTHLYGGENAVKLPDVDIIKQYSLFAAEGYMVTVTATDYLILCGLDVLAASGKYDYYASWWLSDKGSGNCFAGYVDKHGKYGSGKEDTVSYEQGIRPVIYLKTED